VPLWFGLALLCLQGAPSSEASQGAPSSEASQGAPSSEASAAEEGEDEDEAVPFLAEYAPPVVEGPGLRLPEPLTRLSIDAAYARTADLSGLPLIAGKAHNYRFALIGSYRWRQRFSLDAEINFSNITTIDVTQVPGGVPADVDKHQTAASLGDTRLGASWTDRLNQSGSLVGGFGLRLRLPTHTVIFQFHLADGVTLAKYVFPYYFHVEPAAILGGRFGPFAFVVNQGLIVMAGPGGYLQDLYIAPPTLVFWSAHYAAVLAPVRALGLSVDLGTDVQLNHISAMYFDKVNGVVAVSLNVGVQIHLGPYRVDLIGRRGLTRDTDVFGVLQYAATESVTLRVGRHWY
jgi:hypothetical protein